MQNQQEVGCSVLEGLFHFVSFLRHSGPTGGPGFVFLTPPFPFSSHLTILARIPPHPTRLLPCPAELFLWLPPLCGGTKVGILVLPSQILPFDSLPFSHPSPSLASCSIRGLSAGGFPWKQGRKFEKRSTKGCLI